TAASRSIACVSSTAHSPTLPRRSALKTRTGPKSLRRRAKTSARPGAADRVKPAIDAAVRPAAAQGSPSELQLAVCFGIIASKLPETFAADIQSVTSGLSPITFFSASIQRRHGFGHAYRIMSNGWELSAQAWI